eukprot:3636882-Amphidinium_carterae.1
MEGFIKVANVVLPYPCRPVGKTNVSWGSRFWDSLRALDCNSVIVQFTMFTEVVRTNNAATCMHTL